MRSKPPNCSQIFDLERADPGTSYRARKGLDPRFLERMRKCCYLDPRDCRTSGFDRLKLQYLRDGLALFLGAGVSHDSGVPDWRRLIEAMLGKQGFQVQSCTDEERRTSASRILEEQANLSLLAQFDLAAHQCADQSRTHEFVALLRDRLYGQAGFQRLKKLLQTIPFENRKKKEWNWQPVLAELGANTTLAAVGDLLLREKAGRAIEVNPMVHAVLTTNVDNLLQIYAMARAGGQRLLNTVDRPSVADHPDRISVYHLHGWLDARAGNPGDRREAAPSPLVFRESEYFETIANSNAFANYTAQSLFQRCNVLFIGTSMEDLNVRRWLRNSFVERRRHREEVLRQLYPEPYPDAGWEAYAASVRHFWFRIEDRLPEPRAEIKEFISDSMRHLGVEVIWYQKHSEVADYLRKLSKAGAEE